MKDVVINRLSRAELSLTHTDKHTTRKLLHLQVRSCLLWGFIRLWSCWPKSQQIPQTRGGGHNISTLTTVGWAEEDYVPINYFFPPLLSVRCWGWAGVTPCALVRVILYCGCVFNKWRKTVVIMRGQRVEESEQCATRMSTKEVTMSVSMSEVINTW